MKQHFRLALSRREYKRGKGGIRQAIDVSTRIEQNLGELCFAVDGSNAKRLYIDGGRGHKERARERRREETAKWVQLVTMLVSTFRNAKIKSVSVRKYAVCVLFPAGLYVSGVMQQFKQLDKLI